MKWNTGLTLIALAFSLSSCPVCAMAREGEVVEILSEAEKNSTQDYDFKTFHWGDSEEMVRAVEGDDTYTTGELSAVKATYIAYESSIAGKDAILVYYFCEEGLFETKFILTETHSNESLYIDDYEAVKKALTKKYGEPQIDNESWTDYDKKSYYAGRKGDALSYGYLSYFTWYELDRTEVGMGMSADNYVISTTLDFYSKEIEPGEADYSNDF